MSLSVLTLVKDRPGHLAQLIEGLSRSERQPDELVVVDMGSTPAVILPALPFPARTIRFGSAGLPLASARNAAAREARGEMLLFLDVDCIPMSGLIGKMEDVLIGSPALVCSQVFYLGPDDARDKNWSEQDLLTRASPHPARQFPFSGLREERNPGLFWSLVFGIRRSAFFDIGGFDEAFTGYGAEDTDFGFRAKAAHLPLLFMGGAGAFHQHHGAFDPPLQHFADIVRNAQVFHNRWGQWPMEGWLGAFADLGLIEWKETEIVITRSPSDEEICEACRG